MANYLKVSSVKKLIKANEKRCSKDFIEALDKKVEEIINHNMANTKAITLKELQS